MRPGALPAGPFEVSIHPARTDGRDLQRRGVTTGIMRAAEPLLVRLTAELPGQVTRFELATPMERLRDQAAQLGSSPRSNPFYYRRLLSLFAAIEEAGSTEPVRDLAHLLGLPRETAKTQLRVARSREQQRPAPQARAPKGQLTLDE